MYEELVTKLRNCAELNSLSYYKRELMKQAANAIEGLEEKWQTYAETLYAYEHPWIPVTERLPTKGDRVICFGDNGINIGDFVCGDKWCALPWFYLDGEQETGVTHWMPLPKPPMEEEE